MTKNSDPGVDLESLAVMADAMQHFVEIAAGHREKAKQQGFCESAAEEMAVHLHREMITKIFNS